MHSCVKRVTKQFQELVQIKGEIDCPDVWLVDGNIQHWKGIINGPKDSPYEGGRFQIDIIFTNQYPYRPPEMKFDTKVWHPNVSFKTGVICLDILKDQFSPALTARTLLLSIQALMDAPNIADCFNIEAGEQFKTNKQLFVQNAKEWVIKNSAGAETFELEKRQYVKKNVEEGCYSEEQILLQLKQEEQKQLENKKHAQREFQQKKALGNLKQ